MTYELDSECGLKIIDFGNAMFKSEASMYYDSFEVQSLAYRAPEVRTYTHFKSYYSTAIDSDGRAFYRSHRHMVRWGDSV